MRDRTAKFNADRIEQKDLAAMGGASRTAYMRIGRPAQADEITEVALFLAASAPEALLGQSNIVDGGYTIH